MGNYKNDYPDLKSCLEDIFRNEGIECLENSGKLIPMLKDLIPQNPGAINIVKRMSEHGLLREFRKAHTQDETAKNRTIHVAVEKLVNWESIDQGKAEGYVEIFAHALHWTTVVPSSTPKVQNPAEEPAWKRNVLMHMSSLTGEWPQELNLPPKSEIVTVTFLDAKPSSGRTFEDVSKNRDGSVVAWAVQRPGSQKKYDLFFAADGGINGEIACSTLFYKWDNLTQIHFNGNFHTDDAEDMRLMFGFTHSLTSLELSGISTKNAKNMGCMFYKCRIDSALDLSGFDTSHVTDMAWMFAYFDCPAVDFSRFNTSSVKVMSGMFAFCNVPSLDTSAFDMSNVEDVSGMYYSCKSRLTLGRLELRNAEYVLFNADGKFVPFMEDSRTVNGRPWVELCGEQRFEITAPKDGYLSCDRMIWQPGVRVQKGDLLGVFHTKFRKINLYAPCNGVIVETSLDGGYKKGSSEFRKEFSRDKRLFVIYSVHETSQASPAPHQKPNFLRDTSRKAANLPRIWRKLLGHRKKVILGIAAVLLILVLIDSDVFGEPEEIYASSAEETIQWSLTDGVLRISGTGAMPDYVSILDQPWYEQETEVTSIAIEDGVTRIGSGAFEYMENVVDVTMADTVTEIGDSAFYDCIGLQSIQLSNRLEVLGSSAFQGCENLNSVQIPDSVKAIHPHAFFGTGLQSVELSEQCRYSYRSFPVVTVVADGRPASGSIGENSTWELSPDGRLTISGDGSLYLDGTVNNEAAPWYSRRDQISTVSISEGITDLGMGLFANCQNLTDVTLPRTLLDVGWETFQNCAALVTVTLPRSVQSIGNGAFDGCTSLTSIKIPNGVTEIGSYTFWGCSNLKTVTIPNTVTAIGSYAFGNCTSLTGANIPNGVTAIDSSMFSGCTSLKNITLPGTVTKIGYSAFQNCTGLTNINIPNGVTEIGYDAFQGCSGLKRIVIPNGVEKIESSTFEDCTSLTSAVLPKSVISIGNRAFQNCTSLNSISLSAGLTEIGRSAFENCTSLPRIHIPNGVETIGTGTFRRCISLTYISVPESIRSIERDAFEDCTVLTDICIPESCVLDDGALPSWVNVTYF